jgi:hypothetical protein
MFRSTTTLIAALLLAAAAQAQENRFEIVGKPVPPPDAATLSAMTGDFALSDGRLLRVTRPGHGQLMVAVGKKGWAVPMEPAGLHRFESRDGRMLVAFEAGFDSLRFVEPARIARAQRVGEAATQ